jgi:hypothetical protein
MDLSPLVFKNECEDDHSLTQPQIDDVLPPLELTLNMVCFFFFLIYTENFYLSLLFDLSLSLSLSLSCSVT